MKPVRGVVKAAAVFTGLAAVLLVGQSATATAGATGSGAAEPAAVSPAKLVTANVPFGLSQKKARAQIKHAMSAEPGVMLLQEVRHRDVQRIVDGLTEPGAWKVHQPGGAKGASAIAWDEKRFDLAGHGSHIAFRSRAYDRHLLWATLQDVRTKRIYTVVALHYPPNASKDPAMRDLYITMNGNYRKLVKELRAKGRHPVAGGDWNHPLDVRREPWSPVPVNRGLSMTTNWLEGTACKSGTSPRGGRIDGFAYDKARIRLGKQGCLKRLHSDHRPVYVNVVAAEK